MLNPHRFYTYAYLREDKTPYYIGKGQGNRVHKKGKGQIRPPKDKSRIIFLKQNLTEEVAFKHEIYMIAVFGRKDLGTGILQNRTNGGDGCSGRILSKNHKNKISKSNKGKFIGRKLSDETKKKISNANKNKQISENTRKKISSSLLGNKNGKGNKGIKHSLEFCKNISKLRRKPDNEVSSHSLYMRKYRSERKKYNKKEWKNICRQKRIERKTKMYKITFDDGRNIIVNGLRKFAKENGYSSGIFNVMNGTYKKHKNIIKVEKIN